MASRMPTELRQVAIVEAALELLAEVPVHALTTRTIAARVGISQPALFRHFESREAILAAAVARSHRALASSAGAVLACPTAVESLEALGASIADYVRASPWLPSILFHAASAQEPVLGAAVAQLPAMQRALVRDVLLRGVRRGELPTTLDVDRAALLFVSVVQGTLLQLRAEPALGHAPSVLPALIAPLLTAFVAGEPKGVESPRLPGTRLSVLDVRPTLAAGDDPFADILAELSTLDPDGAVLLVAPFCPTPLLQVLEHRGLGTTATQRPSHWEVAITGPRCAFHNFDQLEAPEPMASVLLHAAELGPLDALLACTPRLPGLLLERLDSLGYSFASAELPDGRGLVHVRRRP